MNRSMRTRRDRNTVDVIGSGSRRSSSSGACIRTADLPVGTEAYRGVRNRATGRSTDGGRAGKPYCVQVRQNTCPERRSWGCLLSQAPRRFVEVSDGWFEISDYSRGCERAELVGLPC